MVKDSSFMFSYHLQRQFFEVVGSLTRFLNVKDAATGFSFCSIVGHNLFIQNNSILVLVRLRFFITQFWKLLFEKRQGIRYLKPQYFKKTKKPKQRFLLYLFRRRKGKKRIKIIKSKKLPFTTRLRFVKKRIYALLEKKQE